MSNKRESNIITSLGELGTKALLLRTYQFFQRRLKFDSFDLGRKSTIRQLFWPGTSKNNETITQEDNQKLEESKKILKERPESRQDSVRFGK